MSDWNSLVTRLYRLRNSRQDAETRLRQRILRRVKHLGTVYEDGNSDRVAFTYHPIPFEGFETVPTHRAGSEARLRLIEEHLNLQPGDWILDVGANVGYFAFALARRGALVEAYETNSDTFEIGAALSKLYRQNVLYLNKALTPETLAYLRPHYRAVLLLSIFHWMVKQEGEARATEVLRILAQHTDTIFFEVPTDTNDAMFKHRWFTSRESVEQYLASVLPQAHLQILSWDAQWVNRALWKIEINPAAPQAV